MQRTIICQLYDIAVLGVFLKYITQSGGRGPVLALHYVLMVGKMVVWHYGGQGGGWLNLGQNGIT